MDFNQLMARMRELDQPAQVQEATPVGECGDPMMGQSSMGMNNQMPPPPAHPSMSVNLNAQGMDNIESLMKLMTKVNPDMINQPMPKAIEIEPMSMPSLTPPGPSISSIGDLGNLDAGPLKMLPDLDKSEPHAEPDADNMGGPSDMDADNMPPMGDLDSDDGDDVTKAMGDIDGDGDHDMDDHEAEKEEPEGEEPEDDEEKKEGFGNAVAGSPGSDYKDVDYMVNKLAGGMNKPKQSFSGKAYRGDNPMAAGAYESRDALRASIRSELQQRLAEAKGAK
jgi:hypothetical protein